MMKYSELLYQIGLLDTNDRDYFREKEQEITDLINNGEYGDAYGVSCNNGFDQKF